MSYEHPCGAELIAAERQRQIEVEGWLPSHDDSHTKGELAKAAICYAEFSYTWCGRFTWPWDASWWKPNNKSTVANLVKAGALIAAEIDRMQRAARSVRNRRTHPGANMSEQQTDTQREKKDAVTVGQIRKRHLGLLESHISTLGTMIRQGYFNLPEAEKFLMGPIAKTLTDLQNIDAMASTEVILPTKESKAP